MFQVFSHTSKEQTVRNKIFLPHNLVSFLEQGEKVVHYAGSKTIIAEGYFVILSSGKCLMTEKNAVNNVYRSTMLSFNDISILNFYVKYASVLNNAPRNLLTEKKSFLVFKKDEYIKNFINSLKLLHLKETLVSDQILALKFEELMLYLFEKYPSEILSFRTKNQKISQILKSEKL